MIYRIFQKGVLVLLLLGLFFAQSVLADGTIQSLPSNKVTDISNNMLSQGCVIQFLTVDTPPNDAAPNHLSSGSEFLRGTIGGGNPTPTNTDGTFNYFTEYDGTGYVRIWNTNDISGSVKDKYYTKSSALSLPAPPTPAPTYNFSLQTVYKAAKPIAPKSTVGGFALAYNATKKVYLPSFTISVVDQDDPNGKIKYEIVGRNIRIRKKIDQWTTERTYSVASKEINEVDPESPYYLADGVTWYEIQSQAWNYFGGNTDEDWGAIYPFQIPATGTGEGVRQPVQFIFNLKPYESGKLVVNDISSPKDTNAKDLAAAINGDQTSSNVYAICKWQNNQTLAYLPGVSADADSFEIKAGEAVQVHVKEAKTVTLESQ